MAREGAVDAAQLDRPIHRRRSALRDRGSRGARHRVYDAARHPLRRDVLRRRCGLRSCIGTGSGKFGAGGVLGLPRQGQANIGNGSPGFLSSQDRCVLAALRHQSKDLKTPHDASIYAVLMVILTGVFLACGRYGLIERLSLVLVLAFTLFTFLAVVLLQADPDWAVSSEEWITGLTPSLEGTSGGFSVALAALGIIGVGAAELMVYPYWCLEKGYGKSVGTHSSSEGWAINARGWMRVMRLDAWLSMLVYTLVTVFFYVLGAATLGRLGLVPSGNEMVRTLGQMYVPIFGVWIQQVFLLGAFSVLYSTFFVAAAGNSRMVADGLVLAGLLPSDEASRRKAVRVTCVIWVIAALLMAFLFRAPVAMVLASGVAQAVMLGTLAVAVLYFRYCDIDQRLAPNRSWDVLLWCSAIGFVVIAGWTICQKVSEVLFF